MVRPIAAIAASTALILLASAPQGSGAAERGDFYAGKTIRLVISNDPGGTYDLYARLAVRHLGRFLPGHPVLVPQNMPAAGGLVAANYVAAIAPKDGTVLGSINANVAIAQILGAPGIQYDARSYNWVGRFTSTTGMYFTWHSSPTRTLQDLLTRETLTAGTGPTSNASIIVRVSNELLGTRYKLVNGYNGTAEANLALQRGEVEGVHWNWEGTSSTIMGQWLKDGQVRIVTHYAEQRLPELPDIPSIYEIAKTAEQRQVLRLFGSTDAIGRSLLLPPEVPAERVAAIRDAFQRMVQDADFQADAQEQKLVMRPLDGAGLQALVLSAFDISPENVEVARRYYR